MRVKHRQLVITFAGTAQAMQMEKTAAEVGAQGRIIPLPSQLSAGCGLAWKAELLERENLIACMDAARICWEAIYELELY